MEALLHVGLLMSQNSCIANRSFADSAVLRRFIGKPRQAASQYGADPGCGEGPLQSPEDQTRDTQVWPDLPRQPDRPSASQGRGQNCQSPGSKMRSVHSV